MAVFVGSQTFLGLIGSYKGNDDAGVHPRCTIRQKKLRG